MDWVLADLVVDCPAAAVFVLVVGVDHAAVVVGHLLVVVDRTGCVLEGGLPDALHRDEEGTGHLAVADVGEVDSLHIVTA